MPNSEAVAELAELNRTLSAQVADLTCKVEALATSNEELVRSNKALITSDARNKRNIGVLTVAGIFVVLIGVALAYLFQRSVDNRERSQTALLETEQINASRVISCEAGNTERAITKELLSSILIQAYSSDNGQDAPGGEARRELRGFLNQINKAYPMRDCTPESLTVTGPGRS